MSVFLVLIFWGVAFGGCSDRSSEVAQRASSSLVSSKLQVADFSLPVFGQPHKLQTLSQVVRGRPVVLIFWASWCTTCQKETVVLNDLANRMHPDGPVILAVNVQEEEPAIREFSSRHHVQYSVLMDRDGSVAKKYQVSELPTVILLAKGGEILYYGFRLPKKLSDYFG